MEFKCKVLVLLFSTFCVEGQETTTSNSLNTLMDNNEKITYLAVLIHDDCSFCNGFVLSEKAILTAAHCVQTKQVSTGFYIRYLRELEFTIPMGQINATVNVHPDYNPDTQENDLAIVTLSESLYIEPTPNLTTRVIYENTRCFMSGFGSEVRSSLEDPVPMFKEVEVTACNDQPADHICTAAEISSSLRAGVLCDGDVGAPLVCNNELVGIAVSDNSCGRAVPDVYQSVRGFQTWIEDITLPDPIIIPTSTPITIPQSTPITIPISTPITISAESFITIHTSTPISIQLMTPMVVPASTPITTSIFEPITITTSTPTKIPTSTSSPITISTFSPITLPTSMPVTISVTTSITIPSATPIIIPPYTPMTIPTATNITIPASTPLAIPTSTPIAINVPDNIHIIVPGSESTSVMNPSTTQDSPSTAQDSGSASTSVMNPSTTQDSPSTAQDSGSASTSVMNPSTTQDSPLTAQDSGSASTSVLNPSTTRDSGSASTSVLNPSTTRDSGSASTSDLIPSTTQDSGSASTSVTNLLILIATLSVVLKMTLTKFYI